MIDDWKVIPSEGIVSRAGESVRLEPKVMDVLLHLASHPGEVISRDQLEREVWRGMVVGYDAVTATVIKLRKALQDDARHSRIIKTVPKRGYQLIATISPLTESRPSAQVHADPVGATELTEARPASTSTESATSTAAIKSKSTLLFPAIAALSVVLIVMAISWLQITGKQENSSTSIIVMPIENLDSNQQYEVFVDGVTDDIITDLSRITNLKVFASATSFKYKDQQTTPRELREEIGVDYVLTGNARRHGDDIRINMQLTNTENGINVWAQRYARKVVDVFAVQDEITSSVIDALAIKLSSSKKQQLAQRATSNLQAYEYFLEGQRVSRQQTRQTNAQAREAYRKAIELDPTYGRAYGALAYTLVLDYRHGWTDTPMQNLERALELAQKAVSFDDAIPQTYWSLGYVYLRRKEYNNALKAAEDSIRVSPSYADGYGLLALISNALGQAKKALEYATRGMQLNPYYTWDYLFNAGFAQYMLGNFPEAINFLEQAQTRNENAIPVKLILAASYVKANRLDDAQWAVEQITMLNSQTTISHLQTTFVLTEPELKAKVLDDLRKAGLPE